MQILKKAFHFSVIYDIIHAVMIMDLQAFKAFFYSDFNINSIYAVRQRWTPELPGANLLETPRRSYGFLLLTDYPATFTFPDNHSISAEAGDVMLLPRDARYTVNFHIPPGKAAHPMLLNCRLFYPDGTEPALDFSVTRLCKDDGTLLPLFTEAAALYIGAHPAQLKSAVYRLLSVLFPINREDDCCIGYINSHLTEQFSIPQLAKRCALSESVFRRRFRQLTGQSPIQYINRLKIEKACQLLDSGDIRPTDISEFLNFYSVSYFYRVFKAITGCTPNEYRNQRG